MCCAVEPPEAGFRQQPQAQFKAAGVTGICEACVKANLNECVV